MPNAFTIDITLDDEDLIRHLTRLASILGVKGLEFVYTQAGKVVGAAMEASFAEYPTKQTGVQLPAFYVRTRADGTTYQSKFKSRKQQAYVILLGKKGKIPYRRTGMLGKSYHSSVRVVGHTVSVATDSNLPYTPFVIGDQQNHFLASLGWRNEKDILRQDTPRLTALYSSQVQALLDAIDEEYQGR